MKTLNCPYKPPRPPKCCYRTKFDYFLGRVSPSLFQIFLFSDNSKEGAKFRQNYKKYKINVLRWKIDRRICSRGEYKIYKNYIKKCEVKDE